MTTKVLSVPVTEDAIRARAYEIWQEEGRPEGRHELHWQRAVEWLAGQVSTQSKAAPRIKTAKTKAAPKKK
jgi:hypothetical protein